jgi:XapX domain-containing protein
MIAQLKRGAYMHPPDWLGIFVALAIGGLVRLLRLPVPAPPTVYGALMVLGLTLGYLAVDHLLRR